MSRKYQPGRLDQAIVARAAELLSQGFSKPQVMAQLGIGEGSVNRIRRGEHPALLRMRQPRCPGCGGKLRQPDKPCLACCLTGGHPLETTTKGAA